VTPVPQITTRNARFQQWKALLTNRAKRNGSGQFIVQGVRPITLAVEHGWEIATWLFDRDRTLSRWARETLDRAGAPRVAMAPELLRELGGKGESRADAGGAGGRDGDGGEAPELIAVTTIPPDDLARIPVGPAFLAVVFDRPASPGNLGTLVRSADAFGAAGVIVTGHAADPYDPKAVRASTGSLFAVPVVRAASHRQVLDWVAGARAGGVRVRVTGTDEHGDVDLADHDFTEPTLLVIGNETIGMSASWRAASDRLVRIPIAGSASSLNAATAATVALYEAARQRAAAGAAARRDPAQSR
jgi:tRNA G18 (ribose-2'-O)-methylase SpoU